MDYIIGALIGVGGSVIVALIQSRVRHRKPSNGHEKDEWILRLLKQIEKMQHEDREDRGMYD